MSIHVLTPDTGFRGPVPCVRYPYAGKVHLDGPCLCFVGGPAPVFPQPIDVTTPSPAGAPAPSTAQAA